MPHEAIALSAAQQIEEAQAEFEPAIAVDPNSFEAHFFFARLNFQQGKIERAAAVPACQRRSSPVITSAPVYYPKFYLSLGREQESKEASAARRGARRA